MSDEEEFMESVADMSEVHLVDNDDGTCTMTFVFRDLEPNEFSAVLEISLNEWFGDIAKRAVSEEFMNKLAAKATILPISPRGLD